MKIEIRIDKNCDEPKVIVVTDKVTDEINEIVTRLSDKPSQILAGFRAGAGAALPNLCLGWQGVCRNGKWHLFSPAAAV